MSEFPVQTPTRAAYAMGYNQEMIGRQSERSAEVWAAFLVPYLRPGLRLLDCGCGPGAITVGLAEVVAPGEVIGLDISAEQIDSARERAKKLGLTNVRFEVGSAYELPYPDASFDAVFAANVLEHLADPPRALREMRRVLGPGGTVGVRDPDVSTQRFVGVGRDAQFAELFELAFLQYKHVASPTYAPYQRVYLREAGFEPLQALAMAEYRTTPESLRQVVDSIGPLVREMLGTAGVARERIEAFSADFAAWPDGPDAFWSMTHFAAVGQVPE